MAKMLAPRKALSVSEWADKNLVLSSKSGAIAGPWVTARNPPLREPMDCFSIRSSTHEVALKFPIQFGKSEVLKSVVAYTMVNAPGPTLLVYPSEVARDKGVNQKWQPLFEANPALLSVLKSSNSRETANSRFFKDFEGGQWYAEHAGSPGRLKSISAKFVGLDEVDDIAAALPSGDDPLQMANGRTSAFPGSYRRLYVSTPQMKSSSRIEYLWEHSDQRRYHVPCPHCRHMQPMQWAALRWGNHKHGTQGRQVWLDCCECGAMIEERHKMEMVAAGRWIPEKPDVQLRGYHLNCLYYAIGLGPRWADLVEEWLECQGDPARLKTFVNDRLAEPWEDKSTANVKANIVAERAEPYPLRVAPHGVIRVTAGVDTQDDRFEVQIIGWGRGLAFWVLDYVVLPGDPDADPTRAALTELLNRPIQHISGALLSIEATSIDIFGHRTEAIKAWVRSRLVRRPMASFGAKANTAPILSKAKLHDVTWRGQYDKRGVHLYQLGTVNAKHVLYARLAADHDAQAAWSTTAECDRPEQAERQCHFTDQLPDDYFSGLISEIFNPSKNRFEKRRGSVRNEPLDTWVHAYAAAHHPELRLHRATRADWDRWEATVLARAPRPVDQVEPAVPHLPEMNQPAAVAAPRIRGSIGGGNARQGGGNPWR
jgi:phage terminase large subunit GpA-like protein